MRALLVLSAMISCSSFAAEMHDVVYQGDLGPRNIAPTFENGYLAVYDPDDKIALYAPDGSLMYTASPHVDGASWASITNAGVDTDGTLGGAVSYQIEKGGVERGGIALFSRMGEQRAFLKTGDYLPTHVSFGPDHSIWTIGRSAAEDSDYFVLRNYSPTGKLIGEFLRRSSFEAGPAPVWNNEGGWQLRVVDGKVGALFYASAVLKPGEKPRPMAEWIETDFNGKELGRYDIPNNYRLAYTRNGTLYAQSHDGISVFQPATNRWRLLTGGPPGNLVGAEGESLVFELWGENTLRRVPGQ